MPEEKVNCKRKLLEEHDKMDTMDCGSESSKRKFVEDGEFQNLPPPTPLREMKSAYKRNQITLDSSNGTASSNNDIRRHLANISQGIKT